MADSPATTSMGRIHILGVGNLGRLYAHGLATKPQPPPLTLLLHRPNLLQDWENARKSIEISIKGEEFASNHYDVEVLQKPRDGKASSKEQDEPIENLIVATKAIGTTTALSLVKHRLLPSSNILFIQNGMGIVEEVSETLFPSPVTRPNYFAAVTSHGVYSRGQFRSVFAGQGNIFLSNLPSDRTTEPASDPQSAYLLEQISESSLLNATIIIPQELRLRQFEKLAGNAIINPLTAIFNCNNGKVSDERILPVVQSLARETSDVLLSLPEFRSSNLGAQHEEDLTQRFSPQGLEMLFRDLVEKTWHNTSSMLQDVRSQRETEIDYINGYIVKMGTEMGVGVNTHRVLIKLVKERTVIEIDDATSILGSRRLEAEKEEPS